jgi:hypothetical protein
MLVGDAVENGQGLSRKVEDVIGAGEAHHVPVRKFFRAEELVELECGLAGLIEIEVEAGKLEAIVVLSGAFFKKILEVANGPGGIALEGGHMGGVPQCPNRRVGRLEAAIEKALGIVVVAGIDGQTHIFGVPGNQEKGHKKKSRSRKEYPDKGNLHTRPFGASLRIGGTNSFSKKIKNISPTLSIRQEKCILFFSYKSILRVSPKKIYPTK